MRRTRDLLTYLFASRGAQSRDVAPFTFWPDHDSLIDALAELLRRQ